MGREYVSGDDDDVAGETVGYDEIMGALAALAQQGGMRRQAQQGRRLPGPVRVPANVSVARGPELTASASRVQKLRSYLGLGQVLFNSATATSNAANPLIVEPQRGFRPMRLVVARRESGDTDGISAVINNIFIGDLPQSPSQEKAAPTEMFAPDATDAYIDFDVCDPGMKIQINLSISSAPTGSDFIILTLGFYGDMLRGTSGQTGQR